MCGDVCSLFQFQLCRVNGLHAIVVTDKDGVTVLKGEKHVHPDLNLVCVAQKPLLRPAPT